MNKIRNEMKMLKIKLIQIKTKYANKDINTNYYILTADRNKNRLLKDH